VILHQHYSVVCQLILCAFCVLQAANAAGNRPEPAPIDILQGIVVYVIFLYYSSTKVSGKYVVRYYDTV